MMLTTPTAQQQKNANAAIRKIFNAGLCPRLKDAVARRQPRDGIEFEICLGQEIQRLTGALPSGPLLHAAAGDLIEDGALTGLCQAGVAQHA